MRCHWEIRAWLCKSLSMTDCWRCASVINICFTFHSAVNINFKHKSKQVTRSCLPSILVSDGVLTADSSDSDTEQLLSIPVTSSVRWGLAALLVLVLGPGMESEILAAPAWRRGLQRGGHPPDQLEQVHSLTTRQSQLGNDLGMCVERFSNN